MESFIIIVNLIAILAITAVYLIKLIEDQEVIQLRKDIKKEEEENHSLFKKNSRLKTEKENLVVIIDSLDYEKEVLEQDLIREKKETSRWELNYQSMRRQKIVFQDFLINFKEWDGDKLDKLLKKMLSENKYLKAKQTINELNTNKDQIK